MSFISSLRERWHAPQGYGEILRVGLPLVASMASSTVMQFTDRLFLSHYSVDAIAATLPASLASLTALLTLMGVCGYSSVLIAQYTGAGQPGRVGVALWQGIWCSVVGSALLVLMCYVAEPFFRLVGHEPHVMAMEVEYFQVLTGGSGIALVGSAVGAFFSGRGQTRPVMMANVLAACVNVPLAYLFIFGGLGIPSMGIFGAGLATSCGWLLSLLVLGMLVFTRKNEQCFAVFSGWRVEWAMLSRLLRYGLPSGVNFFVELAAVSWFVFEVGNLGTQALAASNIAFSINSVVFLPMIGLNIAVSTLVGQAMGRKRPVEGERAAVNSLHLALAYMLPWCLVFVIVPGPLMDLFAPGDLTPAQYAPVRELGAVLLFYIAIYSLVDAGSIIFYGALKGAGDTLAVMLLLLSGFGFVLLLPIIIVKYLGLASIHTYWIIFTAYIVALALGAAGRFFHRGWHSIRVIDEADEVK